KRTFYFRLLWTNSQYQSGRRLAGSDFWRLAETDFLGLGSTRASRVTPVRLGLSAPSPNALCPIELGLCACRANELFSEYSFAIALPRKQPPNVDYANFSGKFALAANRGQLTG